MLTSRSGIGGGREVPVGGDVCIHIAVYYSHCEFTLYNSHCVAEQKLTQH